VTTVGNGSGRARFDAARARRRLVLRTDPSGPSFGVSFSLPEGSATALLGPNGAGKSTVARICTGLVPGDLRTASRFAGAETSPGLPAWAHSPAWGSHTRAGGSLGVLVAHRRGEPGPDLPPGPSGVQATWQEGIDRAYEAFSSSGRAPAPERRGRSRGGEQRILSLAKRAGPPAPAASSSTSYRSGSPRSCWTTCSVSSATSDRPAPHCSSSSSTWVRALQVSDHAVLLNQGQVVHHGRVDEPRRRHRSAAARHPGPLTAYPSRRGTGFPPDR